MRRSSLPMVVLAAVAVMPLTGCMTAIKQALREAKGATGEVFPTREVRPGELERFNGVAFRPATTDVGERITPAALLLGFDNGAREIAGDLAADYPGGDPTLTIQTSLIYFQSKGILSGAEALARVKMLEGDRVVIDSVVRSESDAFRAGDEEALSAALARGIRKFLIDNKYTPEKRKEVDKKREEEKKAKEESEA
ncbi:MAG: hypothetical protein IT450_16025 [Phycisphaerales bacterium]|nr:hypothetical protein [Phycisphaerales bacterium]